MTSRERLQNIFRGQPKDRLVWTTMVDDIARSQMPEHIREMSSLDFYKLIGSDVLQWGTCGLTASESVPPYARLMTPIAEVESCASPDGIMTIRRQTDWGELVAVSKNDHPIKYAVASLNDLKVLKHIWMNSRYAENDRDDGAYERLDQKIGDRGIFIPLVSPSPVQQLIEYDMGVTNFYSLLHDYPREMEELLEIMHARKLEEYEIISRKTQAEVVIPAENTSSNLVSPDVYARYSLPQIRDYVDVIHKHGKRAVLHMCGLLKVLLPKIAATGLDGIHGLTEPPIGDTRFEEVLDLFGEDFIIIGVFPGQVLYKTDVSYQEIQAALDAIFTPRIRIVNFLLWLAVDGMPTPVERFHMVGKWMKDNGAL